MCRNNNLFFTLFSIIFSLRIFAHEHDHQYSPNDQVVLWVKKFYPINDRLETYSPSKFPHCRGNHTVLEAKHSGLFDVLQDMGLENSGLFIQFGVNQKRTLYCKQEFNQQTYEVLLRSVSRNFAFDAYLDGLRATGFLGLNIEDFSSIYTKLGINIHKNGNRIVKFELMQDFLEPLIPKLQYNFTYEVSWFDCDLSFENRYMVYFENSAKSHKVRIISVINSIIMMVLVMLFALWVLLRTLRYDLIRYNEFKLFKDEQEFDDVYGWKLVYKDVFRLPPKFWLICCGAGIGVQLFLTVFLTSTVSVVLSVTYEIEQILNYALYIYVAVTPISTFVAAALCRFHGATFRWYHLVTTLFFFPCLLLSVASVISIYAHTLNSNHYLEFSSFMYLTVGNLLLVFPLGLVGLIATHTFISAPPDAAKSQEPSNPIHRRKWYLRFWPLSFLSGVLPFGAIAVEMYFVLVSFWATKLALVLQFFMLMLIVMVVISVSTNIISTYLLLNSEDFRWHWLSCFNGLTVGCYAMAYAILHQLRRVQVSGSFQLTFYYLSSLVISLSIGMICAAFNFIASSCFVHKLYSSIKPE